MWNWCCFHASCSILGTPCQDPSWLWQYLPSYTVMLSEIVLISAGMLCCHSTSCNRGLPVKLFWTRQVTCMKINALPSRTCIRMNMNNVVLYASLQALQACIIHPSWVLPWYCIAQKHISWDVMSVTVWNGLSVIARWGMNKTVMKGITCFAGTHIILYWYRTLGWNLWKSGIMFYHYSAYLSISNFTTANNQWLIWEQLMFQWGMSPPISLRKDFICSPVASCFWDFTSWIFRPPPSNSNYWVEIPAPNFALWRQQSPPPTFFFPTTIPVQHISLSEDSCIRPAAFQVSQMKRALVSQPDTTPSPLNNQCPAGMLLDRLVPCRSCWVIRKCHAGISTTSTHLG